MPAVPEPLDRRPQLRRRRRALRRAAATARASTSPTTARAVAAPAARRRRTRAAIRPAASAATMTPPTAEGGALRAQSFRRPSRRAGAAERRGPARRPGDRRCAARQPGRRQQRRERAADRRLRPSQPVPLHHPAAVERPLDRRRRLGHLGGDQPAALADDVGRSTSAGPATRATRPQPGYQSAGLNLCTSLYSAGTATSPLLHVQPQRARRRRRQLPDRQLVDHRARLLHGRQQLSRGVQQRPVLRATTRGTASGSCPSARTASPDPTRVQAFESGAPGPVDLEIGPNGDLFYVDLNTGTIQRDQVRRRRQQPADGGGDGFADDRAPRR